MDGSTAILFLIPFALSMLIHLFFAFTENEKWRKITKPINLLFLTLAALIILPTHPLIYIGALMGMIGDIFLLRNHHKPSFIIGAIFFLVGHMCYISEIFFIIIGTSETYTLFYIIAPLALLLFTFGGSFLTRKIVKDSIIGVIGALYVGILLMVTIVSIIACTKGYTNYMYFGIIGGICFLASDLLLTQATYVKDFKRRDFYIMLTYLIGQLFIVLGLLFTTII